ncbi:hypothetical protein LguiB_020843 [Lonicera macranthoides]
MKLGNEIMDYIKRFWGGSLKIKEYVTEKRLIRIFVKGLLEEYRVRVINDAYGTFQKFAEKTRNIGPSFTEVPSIMWEGPFRRLTRIMTLLITFSEEDKAVLHFHN